MIDNDSIRNVIDLTNAFIQPLAIIGVGFGTFFLGRHQRDADTQHNYVEMMDTFLTHAREELKTCEESRKQQDAKIANLQSQMAKMRNDHKDEIANLVEKLGLNTKEAK